MNIYSFTIKNSDQVLHSVEDVKLSDAAEAWVYIEQLARQFPSPGLRVIVKDESNEVVIMAGLNASNNSEVAA